MAKEIKEIKEKPETPKKNALVNKVNMAFREMNKNKTLQPASVRRKDARELNEMVDYLIQYIPENEEAELDFDDFNTFLNEMLKKYRKP